MTRSRILPLALALIALPLVAVPLLDSFARSTLYPAPRVPVPSPPPEPLTEVRLETDRGDTVIGWAGGEDAPAGAPRVLFFHGNGENLATLRMAGAFGELAALDVAYLAIDYPGYGNSSGKPAEERIAAAADAALTWAHDHRPERPVVSCGWSIGAAVAIGLAARHPGDAAAVIALSPWTSLPELARRYFPGPLVSLALADRYDSLAAAPEVEAPALMIHGGRDPIIPAEQGRRLAEAWGGPVEHREIAAAGHNDLLAHPEVWSEIGSFLGQLYGAQLDRD